MHPTICFCKNSFNNEKLRGIVIWSNKSRVGSQIVPSVITVLMLFAVMLWESQFTFASFFLHLQSRRIMRIQLMLAQPWIPQRAKSYDYKPH